MRVFAVNPGATQSEFFDIAGGKPSGGMAPTVDVITATMRQIDSRGSQPSVVVGGRNAFMSWISARLPAKTVIRVAGKMFLPPVTKSDA